MNRYYLLKLIEQYKPLSSEEHHVKDRISFFVARYPQCFERSLSIGHITASSWLVNINARKALLMHHAKLNMWVQLGGHCDGNPDVLSVAVKEAQEESGIIHIVPVMTSIFDIDIHYIPDTPDEPAHYHYGIRFLLKAACKDTVIQNSESKELRWIPQRKDALPTKERSVVRLFEKWIFYTA